ncbi:MAG: hypothetical protein K2L54_00335 [Clostridiales bacterium]|nr:hypothetical protein [Clostridiales bacterium]
MDKICSVDDLITTINEYGILPFWTDEGFSAWAMSGVNFNAFWSVREKAVNTNEIVYGKFVNKKATFVSREVFPYLASLRRDGYDFDSLTDEGKAPRREIDIMNAIGDKPTPSYSLGKSLEMKGFDGAVTSLQNKTYLCLNFKKSAMGTALLCRPEDVFGYDYVRSKYDLSPEENARELLKLAKGLQEFDEKTRAKILSVAV